VTRTPASIQPKLHHAPAALDVQQRLYVSRHATAAEALPMKLRRRRVLARVNRSAEAENQQVESTLRFPPFG